ncbi:MAG: YIP1 family protein [Dehalococcoidales bacterium]|nr:YIP1 family protein [Dehalococcoidales bacterium]
MATNSIFSRMLRAAKLDINLYEEVEADTSANRQAFLAVVLVSLATGIGSGFAGLGIKGGIWFLWGLLVGLAASIIGWLAWSFTAYIIGTKIFKGPETSATWGELLRTIGFSNSPGILRIFSFIPFIGGIISFAASIWALIAGVIAVRQALDFSTGRAIATCIVGWIIYILIVFLFTGLLLGTAAFF